MSTAEERLPDFSVLIRKKQGDQWVHHGSGFLYVPKEGENAYVLTAAHVLSDAGREIQVEFTGNPREPVIVPNDNETHTILHEKYTGQKTDHSNAHDAALICIPKEDWMRLLHKVYFGEPKKGMSIHAIGFPGVDKENCIESAYRPLDTHVWQPNKKIHHFRSYYENNEGLRPAVVNPKVAHGMSGSVYVSIQDGHLVLIGMLRSYNVQSGKGELSNTDMDALRELLERKAVKTEMPPPAVKRKPRRISGILVVCTLLAAALCLLLPWLHSKSEAELKILKEMPEGLTDYSVAIHDRVVSLPTTFAVLEHLGWACVPDKKLDDRMIAPDTYGGGLDENGEYVDYKVTMTNGHGRIDAVFGNPTGHMLNVKDCIIYQLKLYSFSADDSYTGDSVNKIEGPLALVLGQSKWSEINWPKGYIKRETGSHRGTGSYITYSYIKKSDYDYAYQYRFDFDLKTGVLDVMTITNMDVEAMAAQVGAYETQPPTYDPEELRQHLGVDAELIVGDYHFPLGKTVSEYQDMGYTIEKAPMFVASGQEDTIYFRCDALNQMSCQIYNPYSRAMAVEHCFVSAVGSQNSASYEENFILRFTIGEQTLSIYKGMTLDELNARLEEMGITLYVGGDGHVFFCPVLLMEHVYIFCTLSDNATRQVVGIGASADEALQNFFGNETESQ